MVGHTEVYSSPRCRAETRCQNYITLEHHFPPFPHDKGILKVSFYIKKFQLLKCGAEVQTSHCTCRLIKA